jgi:hypothetical protein
MREFTVKQGCMGYIVNIGCQVCGFSNVEDLKEAICEYLDDPEATENKYYRPNVGLPEPAIREPREFPSGYYGEKIATEEVMSETKHGRVTTGTGAQVGCKYGGASRTVVTKT